MKDPNKGCSEETLRRLKEESYERLRIELFNSIEKLLEEFGMTWNDLAGKLPSFYAPFNMYFNKEKTAWEKRNENGGIFNIGQELRECIGIQDLTLEFLNEIAHCFSTGVYIIFRPRFPYVGT